MTEINCKSSTLDASVSPTGSLELLSQQEVERLKHVGHGSIYELFRRCALAVLNCEATSDSAEEVYKQYPDFEVEIVQRTRGIKLQLKNAPACAFVDGTIINGVKEHLFAVLRDIVLVSGKIYSPHLGGTPVVDDAQSPEAIRFRSQDEDGAAAVKNMVFHVLRNANLLQPRLPPRLVVCWGGHAISREEYDYSKAVGYQLGLRGLDICTGCGPGAMKGPMKGATIAHSKQRISRGRYIGISEPGIIAAESPNPIVNHLVLLPDIEKRLEAFVRFGHAIIVFPGGVGTLEEILFLLGTLMDAANETVYVPLIFTEPSVSHGYFRKVDQFLVDTLGEGVRRFYHIIEEDPVKVARLTREGVNRVARQRRSTRDAFYYNWLLRIPDEMKQPFEVSHENMASLRLSRDLPAADLAINLRRAFSGIVAGNVKDGGIRLVREKGPFLLRGDVEIMDALDALLRDFVDDGRMKLIREQYNPCYTIEPLEESLETV